jgi:U3 small nucleolar RNA-associated protein 15
MQRDARSTAAPGLCVKALTCSLLPPAPALRSAVHSSLFTADGLRVMTGCDDGIVRAWDLGTSKQLFSLRGSADYVRAQSASPASRHIWATGSYDRRARVYDLRTRQALFTLDHGSQVDQVILLPGGSRAVTLGGPELKVWDFFAGGKMVGCLRNHAKAITCGALSAGGEYLLTGGLDGQVKVHDASSLDLISSMSFGGQVLSLAVAPQSNRIAVGLVDGTVDVRAQRGSRGAAAAMPGGAGGGLGDEPTLVPQQTGALKERLFDGWGRGFEKPKRKDYNPGSMRYYLRGQSAKPTDDRDVVVRKRRRTGLKTHDVLLKKFAYGEALDSVMAEKWTSRRARVAVSLVEELVARDGLRAALSGRNASTLEPVLALVCSKIADPTHSTLLSHLANTVLDMYGHIFGRKSRGDGVDGLLFKIRAKVEREVETLRQLASVQGMLEMLPLVTSGAR